MGTSAAERIALQIDVDANTAGATAARAAINSVGKAVVENATLVNTNIGAFEAYGKKIDLTSTSAVAGYRRQGDALSANLARLGATEAELNRVGAAIVRVERAAGASMFHPNSPQSQQIAMLPGRMRTAANGMAVLSQAAVTGSNSLAGMAAAAGNVATALGSVATSARIAAAATGIGAIVTIGVAAFGAYRQFNETTKESQRRIADLAAENRGLVATMGGNTLLAKRIEINRQIDQEIVKTKELKWHDKERDQIISGLEVKRRNLLSMAEQELKRERAEQAKQSYDALQAARNRVGGLLGELEGGPAQRRRQIEQEFETELLGLRRLNTDSQTRREILLSINDARRYGLELMDQESRAQRAQLMIQGLRGSDDFFERRLGVLAEIEFERQQTIKQTGFVVEAERIAEMKKRELRRETTRQAGEDAKTIFAIMRDSSNKSLAAVGTFGDTIRRVIIGAKAAESLVEAAKSSGHAIASLAIGDLRGAALHGAAAAQFGAAAALGARESLGSGGGGSTAAGSGGYSAGGFAPRPQGEGGQNITVILQTVNPLSQEVISMMSYELQRGGVLKRPISSSVGYVSTPLDPRVITNRPRNL